MVLINVHFTEYNSSRLIWGLPKKTHHGCYNGYHLNHALEDSGYTIREYINVDLDKIPEEFEYFGNIEMFGIADHFQEVLDKYFQPIIDKKRQFVIEWYRAERGEYDNWRKYGSYIGKRKSLYDTIGDPKEDKLIIFHIIEILQKPSFLYHLRNILTVPKNYIVLNWRYRQILKEQAKREKKNANT